MESKIVLFKELLKEYRALIERMLFTSGDAPAGTPIDLMFKDIDEIDFMKKYTGAFRVYMEGGKRLRAFLAILGYNMCGHETDRNIVLASLSYELFQNAALIHDDIIDESDLRRNKPTIHVVFGNNKVGISKAICIGDLGIVVASDAILLSEFEDSCKLKALANQNKIFKLTVAGELKDIELEKEECSLEDIIRMYELKTSWYTFIGPLQLGIILGGGDDELLKQAERAGRLIGIAFQIRDDLIGIYGETYITGKSNLTDIEEGKTTVLTSYFRDKATQKEKDEFNSIYGKGKCDEQGGARIRKLLDESGAHSSAEELYKKYVDEATDAVNEMNVSRRHKDVLSGLMEYLNESQG